MFYVYEWFIVDSNEIIYVGKGCRNRYKFRKHNRFFNDMVKRFKCGSRIIKYFEKEEDAFKYEAYRISELKEKGQCVCNIHSGGCGGTVSWWTDERRNEYSYKNVMKSKLQRERMSKNNPMKNKETAKVVGLKHRKKIVVGDKVYDGLNSVSMLYGASYTAPLYWLERGYTPDHKPCYYLGDEKPIVKLKTHEANKRKVIIDGVLYESVKDGAKSLGISSTKLINVIKNGGKYNEHTCKYDNQ